MCLHNTQKKSSFSFEDRTREFLFLDTGGQERFRALRSSIYRGLDVVFLVYAVNDKKSFEQLDFWLSEIRRYSKRFSTDENVPVVVVANKIDVDDRVISREEGEAYAAKIGSRYLETSAKTGQNVQEIIKLTFELTSHSPKTHGCCSVQ